MPDVTSNDYFLSTETTYKSILSKEDKYDDISSKWETLKNSKKYIHHISPKSESEYLINEKNGDILRYSDHWGKVASCEWDLISENTSKWNIAKSNLKDFKRMNSGIYLNPSYIIKYIEAAKLVLPKIKETVSDNKEFYLTKKANEFMKQIISNILEELRYNTDICKEEIQKLKEEYYELI